MNADADPWNQPDNGYTYTYTPEGSHTQAADAYPYPDQDGLGQGAENVPINDMQYSDYGGAEAQYQMGVNVTAHPTLNGPPQLTHIPGERDYHWQFIHRHLQQVKPFSAGKCYIQ